MLNELWSFLASWYNLPYTSLVAVSLLLALVQLMGLGGEPAEDSDLASAEADTDVDAAVEADTDADADVDTDVDTDVGNDVDHDVDHDLDHALDHGAGVPSALGLLAFLGLGKAPLFVVLPILFAAIGLMGWLFNALAQSVLGGLAAWSFLLGLALDGLVHKVDGDERAAVERARRAMSQLPLVNDLPFEEVYLRASAAAALVKVQVYPCRPGAF